MNPSEISLANQPGWKLLLPLAVAVTLFGCAHQRQLPPPKPPELPPPGMVAIEVVSADERVWDVFLGDTWDDKPVCTTPCMQWVDPRRPLFLYSQGNRAARVVIPSMTREIFEARNGLLVATGRQDGKNTTGIVFTSLGGMGVIVGTALTAIGCSEMDRLRGMCNAGLITLGASVPLTAASIWMMVDAIPHVDLFPVYRQDVAQGQPPVTVAFAPNGISGTF